MPLPESALSVAVQSFADFLDTQSPPDVAVSVDTPNQAQKTADDSTSDFLNVFAYRLSPSGFHPEVTSNEPFFVRVQVLLTAFPRGQGTADPDADLRVLGHAVRVLHSTPVIPVILPGPLPGGAEPGDFREGPTTDYALQAVMQAPTMEELNHIWTTQGGELAYRVSAAYELAVVPIDPLSRVAPAPDVQVSELVVAPGIPRPTLLFRDGARLTTIFEAAAGAADVPVVVTGRPMSNAVLIVDWRRADGRVERQTPQLVQIQTDDINAPGAQFAVTLDSPANADRADIAAVPSDASGTILREAKPSNVLTLTIGP